MSGMMLIGLALLSAGAALWILGYYRQHQASRGEVVSMDDSAFEQQLTGLVKAYPELLPSVPASSFEYDNWFQEVLKRVQLRSMSRTHAEGLVLLKQIGECHQEWLKITRARKALFQELGKDKKLANLEELEYEHKQAKLQLEIAKIQAEMANLKNPPAVAPMTARRDPVEEAISKIRQTLRTVAGVEAECDQLAKDNPAWAEYILDERRRILMDLRNRR